MNSKERHEARYQRRKAAREEKRRARLGEYDNFDNLLDANNLIGAFKCSQKGVSWKSSVQRYEMNLLQQTNDSKKKLAAGEPVAQGFIEFDLRERGKMRHIKSVHIKERCIQRVLCDHALVPVLSNSLIYDNGASLENKGIHFSLDRLDKHLHWYYRHNNFSNDGYILMIDFSSYFDNIRHDHCYEIIEKSFKDQRIKDLAKELIEPFRGKDGSAKSLGIGSQISQILAISYPNTIDHFIKEKLGIKCYGRYMDDSYIIHKDKKFLRKCLDILREKYKELGIVVNEKKTQIVKLSRGFTFLKTRHYLTESGKIVKKPHKASVTRERRKLKSLKKKELEGLVLFKEIYTQYKSWRGHISHTNAYQTIQNMDKLFDSLFVFNKENGGIEYGNTTFRRFQENLPGRVRKIMREQNIDYIPGFESGYSQYRKN